MRPRVPARAGLVVAAALLFLVSAQGAFAQAGLVGTNDWTIVSAPSFAVQQGNPVAIVAYSSHVGISVTGIVVMLLRNNASQTVSISVGTTTIAGGQIGSADLVEFSGLPHGTYNATIFAFALSGVALSTVTTAQFKV